MTRMSSNGCPFFVGVAITNFSRFSSFVVNIDMRVGQLWENVRIGSYISHRTKRHLTSYSLSSYTLPDHFGFGQLWFINYFAQVLRRNYVHHTQFIVWIKWRQSKKIQIFNPISNKILLKDVCCDITYFEFQPQRPLYFIKKNNNKQTKYKTKQNKTKKTFCSYLTQSM